jgi:hypothetical protein
MIVRVHLTSFDYGVRTRTNLCQLMHDATLATTAESSPSSAQFARDSSLLGHVHRENAEMPMATTVVAPSA